MGAQLADQFVTRAKPGDTVENPRCPVECTVTVACDAAKPTDDQGCTTMTINLQDYTAHALDEARASERGRFAELILRDGELRQSIIALTEGSVLPEHNSPPAGSIQVLHGQLRVELQGHVQGNLSEGDLWALTHQRHEVRALSDTVFLLTTVTSVERDSYS